MDKRTVLLVAVIMALGGWSVEAFPDPYHKDGVVNIYTWIYRGIHEQLRGTIS